MRYLITGGSGYIGTRLVELLSRREDTEKIVICDVAPPKGGYRPKTEFERVDVRDRGAVHSALQRANPDVLVHLAFILNPSHDEDFMYDVDVNGTHNVLEAAAEAGIAAGARDDLRRRPTARSRTTRCRSPRTIRCAAWPRFSYARDKTESDRICQLWALQHPERDHDDRAALHRVRAERGQLPRAALDQAAVRRRRGQPRQPDPVRARGRRGGRRGRAADRPTRRRSSTCRPTGLMTLRECAELLETPIRKMPLWLYRDDREGAVAPAPVRGASRSDRLRALPVDRVEREDQGERSAGPRSTRPARPSRSRCEHRGSWRPHRRPWRRLRCRCPRRRRPPAPRRDPCRSESTTGARRAPPRGGPSSGLSPDRSRRPRPRRG